MRRNAASLSFAAAAALAVALLASAAPARAQDRVTKGSGYVEKLDVAGQNMIFDDDPLAALPLGAGGGIIAPRPSAARMGLLRPRTHFIPEMLKSVEAL